MTKGASLRPALCSWGRNPLEAHPIYVGAPGSARPGLYRVTSRSDCRREPIFHILAAP